MRRVGESVRLIIADDHPLIRTGIRKVLDAVKEAVQEAKVRQARSDITRKRSPCAFSSSNALAQNACS